MADTGKSPIDIAGAIGGALPLVGGIVQGITDARTSRENTDKTISANKELAQYAYSKDLEMWNRQNQYNTPEAQRARLDQAGLNPNLVYGTGTVAGNTSGQIPKYQAPTVDYKYKSPIGDIPSMLGQTMALKMQQAQIENINANTANKNVDTAYLAQTMPSRSNLAYQKDQSARTAYDLQVTASPEQIRQIRELTKQAELRTEGMRTANDIANQNRIYNNYRNEWAKVGVTSGDNPIIRMLTKMPNVQQWLEKFFGQ